MLSGSLCAWNHGFGACEELDHCGHLASLSWGSSFQGLEFAIFETSWFTLTADGMQALQGEVQEGWQAAEWHAKAPRQGCGPRGGQDGGCGGQAA